MTGRGPYAGQLDLRPGRAGGTGMDGEILFLGPEDVAALLDPAALLEALAADVRGRRARGGRRTAAFAGHARGGGGLLVMPGHRPGLPLVVKHVGLFEGNVARGLPHHPATICAFDEETGVLRAVLDATQLTAVRTAGAAALSIRLAARADARVAAVIGAGPVAAAHLAVLAAVRDFDEIRVAARSPERARTRWRARHGARRASTGSRPPCAAPTSSACARARPSRCWRAAGSAPGVHLTSVGYAPPGGELDPALGACRAAARGVARRVRAAAGGLRRARRHRPGLGRGAGRGRYSARGRAASATTSSRSTSRWAR